VVRTRREGAALNKGFCDFGRNSRLRQSSSGEVAVVFGGCIHLKPEVLEGVDLVFVRELTGGSILVRRSATPPALPTFARTQSPKSNGSLALPPARPSATPQVDLH